MEQDALAIKNLALLLLSDERANGSGGGANELQGAVQRTFDKLNAHLARRLGSDGYHALLKRSVALAATEYPWLASVRVTGTGDLEGFEPLPGGQALSETAAGFATILASLIGLLETFIGRNLCLRMLLNVWPDAIQIETGGSLGDSNG
jgi:hypothetical protein